MSFSENFEAAKNLAMEAAQTAAAKAKELAAVAKANISIYAEEDKVKKAEIELGKLYYRDYAVGEELDSAEYLPWCQKIDESKKAIADLKDYIASLRTEEEPAEAEDAPTDDDFEIVVADEAPKAEEAPEAPKAPAEAAPAEEAPTTEEYVPENGRAACRAPVFCMTGDKRCEGYASFPAASRWPPPCMCTPSMPRPGRCCWGWRSCAAGCFC